MRIAIDVPLLQLDVSGTDTVTVVDAVVTATGWLASGTGADDPLLNIFEKKPDTLPGIAVTDCVNDDPVLGAGATAGLFGREKE